MFRYKFIGHFFILKKFYSVNNRMIIAFWIVTNILRRIIVR